MSWRVECVLDSRSDLAESPWWDAATRQLLWIDLFAGTVNSLDVSTGINQAVRVGQPVGMAVGRSTGGVVVAVRDGVGFVDIQQGTFDLVLGLEGHLPANRANDGYCDAHGRLWVGTMAFEQTPGAGSVYCVHPDLSVEVAIPETTTSNGIDWSPDGRTMYFADTATGRVDAYDFDIDLGQVGQRRPLIDIPVSEGRPDGLTVDAEGDIWLALWGGGVVRLYDPRGRHKETIAVPAQHATSVAFGGEHLDTLFITTARSVRSPQQAAAQPHAGSLFAVQPGTTGRAPTPFAG